MRPGQQQNKQRMRGRGRKGPNPMSRSFESNGPDVKIRGTAQHIADKYTTLARDASASGDRVMAENYLQHAEHYGRIVAAAQGQFQPSQPERDFDDMDDEAEDGVGADMGSQQPFAGDRGNNGQGGYQNGQGGYQSGDRQAQGYRDNRDNNQPRGDRDNNQPRGDRNERRDFRDNRGERPQQNRDNPNRDNQSRDNRDGNPQRGERDNYPPRDQRDRGVPQAGYGPQPVARDADDGETAQPVRTEGGRNEGGRHEGGRREGRRERQRLNGRDGERRFEDRFARPSSDENRSGDAASPADENGAVGAPQTEQPRASQPLPEPVQPAMSQTPIAADETRSAQNASGAPSSQGEGATELRRRGRPRRERTEGEVTAEVPSSPLPDSPATVSANVDLQEPATGSESRRKAPKAAAPEAEATASDEAPAKRRPGRPRKKKTNEGGEADPHLPAFLLASND